MRFANPYGGATAERIREALAPKRTILIRLEDKGYVKHKLEGVRVTRRGEAAKRGDDREPSPEVEVHGARAG